MKKVIVAVAACALVAVVAVAFLVGNLDRIIKGALESTGSELLGTRVTVAEVDFDLTRGAGRVSGLAIANPDGYSQEEAFRMGEIRLDLELSSLKKEPLVVRELAIRDPAVLLEAKADGSSNLQTLLDNIEENGDRADRAAAAGDQEPVRISFGKLAVTGVKVEARIPGREPETIVIPDIVMRDVGKEAGLTPGQVGSVVLGEIIAKSLEATVKKKMTEKVREAAGGVLEDLRKKFLPGEEK